jgi:hypothetical protein
MNFGLATLSLEPVHDRNLPNSQVSGFTTPAMSAHYETKDLMWYGAFAIFTRGTSTYIIALSISVNR